jgi:hypothetical protein
VKRLERVEEQLGQVADLSRGQRDRMFDGQRGANLFALTVVQEALDLSSQCTPF